MEGWKGKGRGGKGERKERGGEGKGKEEEGRGGEVCVIAVAEIDAPGIKTNYLRSDWVLNTDDGDARKICDDAGFVVPVRFFTARHLHLIRLRLLYTHHGPCKSGGRIQIAIRFKSRSKHLPMIRSDYSRRFELNWTPGRVQTIWTSFEIHRDLICDSQNRNAVHDRIPKLSRFCRVHCRINMSLMYSEHALDI